MLDILQAENPMEIFARLHSASEKTTAWQNKNQNQNESE